VWGKIELEEELVGEWYYRINVCRKVAGIMREAGDRVLKKGALF
jgi:hypothetical protein